MSSAPAARWRWPRWTARRFGAALLLLALLIVAPHLGSGTELVRLRNALMLGADLQPGDDWAPPQWPADFKRETVAPDPYFVSVADRLGLQRLPDDWSRAMAIGRHLLARAYKPDSGPIQSDLRTTHRRIVEEGDGYCGDYVRAFTAIANAAGMAVRPWAFSFDGFGGHGHIWVELWNRDRQRWQLIDVFQNYVYLDAAGEPLSAAQLRRALLQHDPALRLVPIERASPPGWAEEPRAWAYLQRGIDQWYAPWGTDVMTNDGQPLARTLGRVSRAAQALTTIVLGSEPRVRLLATPTNEAMRASMRRLRLQLFVAGGLGVIGLLLLFVPATANERRGGARPAARKAGGAATTETAGPLGAGTTDWPRVCVVGPLPPPSGGMANQCEQLVRLLRGEGASVELVRTNAPYVPAWTGHIPVLRAGVRLVPYLGALWRTIGRADVVHVFANSGWAWHLLCAPALRVARWRGVPAIVNYRGGQAEEFLVRTHGGVHRALAGAAMRVTPSAFLQRVFARHGLDARVIPNIVDLARFTPAQRAPASQAPHLVVTRNLEPIYDIPTALRAFARVREALPGARLTVAGSGPQRDELIALADSMGLADAVNFSGRIDNADIPRLYADADLMLNPSTADNMPISILEALASGVPIVSTDAGGIPDLVRHGETALLVPVGDDAAMAAAALRVLRDDALARCLRESGVAHAAQFAWPQVREAWRQAYREAMQGTAVGGAR